MSNVLPQDADNRSQLEPANWVKTGSQSADADRRDSLRRQEAVVAMGRRAIASPDLSLLTQDAAWLIAEMLGGEHSCVAKLTSDKSRIIHTLAVRESGSTKPLVFVEESGTGGSNSLAGHALEVAHPVVVAELSQETGFSDPFLQHHGVRSAIAVPLTLLGQSFGALVAGTRQIRRFNTEDALFVETVAHLVTTTIGRIRLEKTLAEERHVFAEVVQALGDMVLVLDTQGRIVRVNRVCEELTGVLAEGARGRAIWDVFGVPEETDLFEMIFGNLRTGTSRVEYQNLVLRNQSGRRRITWSFFAVRGPDESIESVLATGVDATLRRLAEEQEEQAEPDAETESLPGKETKDQPWRATDNEGLKADGDPPSLSFSNRRRAPRRSYPFQQLIAPLVSNMLPDEDAFFEVECNDISVGGFSFLSRSPPQYDMLVVALGPPPKLIYLTAQVAHVNRIRRGGRRMYVVGCSYTGRTVY